MVSVRIRFAPVALLITVGKVDLHAVKIQFEIAGTEAEFCVLVIVLNV